MFTCGNELVVGVVALGLCFVLSVGWLCFICGEVLNLVGSTLRVVLTVCDVC